jgi:hypothetical protein
MPIIDSSGESVESCEPVMLVIFVRAPPSTGTE